MKIRLTKQHVHEQTPKHTQKFTEVAWTHRPVFATAINTMVNTQTLTCKTWRTCAVIEAKFIKTSTSIHTGI